MLEKLKRILGVIFFVQLGLGAVGIVTLVLTPRVVIGVGQVRELTEALELFNFKWLLLGILLAAWSLPIILVLIYRNSKAAGLEVNELRAMVSKMLEGSNIPIMVDIDTDVPVRLPDALRVPVQLDTKIDIDQQMEIEAEFPISTELPIDTTISTSVLGLGHINIPIKARLPLDVVVPVSGALRVIARGIPISIDEEARIRLPPFEVPLKCRVETQIDILSNLKAAESRLVGKPDSSGTTS